jgi:hypothetical protein
MLEQAYFHKKLLIIQLAIELLKPENKNFIFSNWFNLEEPIKIEDSYNANIIQYVSIIDNKILGYFSYSVFHYLNVVDSVVIILFDKKSMIAKRDLYKFFLQIKNSSFYKVNFRCTKNNPARKMYERIIKKYKGRFVGYLKNDVQLLDNSIDDVYLYELILNKRNKNGNRTNN